VKLALDKGAAACLLFHNHSAVNEPSHADELITTRVRDALALIEVRTLDHLIVGAGGVLSMAEKGLL
jgi:DNA repair protein RadC